MKFSYLWLISLCFTAIGVADEFPLYMPFHHNAQAAVAGWNLEGTGGELQPQAEGKFVLLLQPGSRLASKSFYAGFSDEVLEITVRARGTADIAFTVGFYGWKGWVGTQRQMVTLTPEMREHMFTVRLTDSAERSGDSLLFGIDNSKAGQPAVIEQISVRRQVLGAGSSQ